MAEDEDREKRRKRHKNKTASRLIWLKLQYNYRLVLFSMQQIK